MSDAGRAPNTTDFNPVFAQRLEAFRTALTKAGIESSISSGYRTPEYQNQMYQNHLAKKAHQPLPYPKVEAPDVVAAPWKSFHNYGIATDLILKNPHDYARMAEMAKQFGLSGIGPSDPGHIQLAGSLDSNITQYKLAGWRPDSSPAPASGAIAYGGPGNAPMGTTVNASNAPIAGGLAKSASPYGNPFLDSLATIESNNQNIFSGVDKDYPGQPGSRSQGYFQIDTPTWQQFAAKAGIDIVKYPSAMNAPPEVQAQVAQLIPFSRFGQRTQDMLAKQYGALDKKATIGELASKVGGGTTTPATAVAGAAPAAAPAPAADQPWWSKYTTPPVDKEGNPVEGARSPVEKAIAAFTGSDTMKARMEAQAPAGGSGFGQGPGARNVSPGLQNIAQTYGQTLNSYMQPLTWNSAPPGVAGMRGGFQGGAAGAVPGLSLNSVQAPPEGLGYGIASNYGLG